MHVISVSPRPHDKLNSGFCPCFSVQMGIRPKTTPPWSVWPLLKTSLTSSMPCMWRWVLTQAEHPNMQARKRPTKRWVNTTREMQGSRHDIGDIGQFDSENNQIVYEVNIKPTAPSSHSISFCLIHVYMSSAVAACGKQDNKHIQPQLAAGAGFKTTYKGKLKVVHAWNLQAPSNIFVSCLQDLQENISRLALNTKPVEVKGNVIHFVTIWSWNIGQI